MLIDEAQYDDLHSLVFRDDYAGYRPNVAEIPSSKGQRIDHKKFAHVAYKYNPGPELVKYLERAHAEAMQVAYALKCPEEYLPDPRYGALRVLDYAPGDFSQPHTDFDLFTTMHYRNLPACFRSSGANLTESAARINPQCHLGRMAEMIGLGDATLHEVVPSNIRQKSVVYFAIPDHNAVLPNGETVGEYLQYTLAASRKGNR